MLAHLTLPCPPVAPVIPRAARVRVRSAEDLRRALRESRGRPLAIDASALRCVLRADADRGHLEVQGAMSWAALAAALGERGEPIARWNSRARPPETVARAVSLDAPAPDGRPLAAYVEAVALVTLDGELRRLDRAHEPRLFRHAVGGHGVFGLIYSVTLRIAELLRAAAGAPPLRIAEPAGSAAAAGAGFEVDALLPPERAEGYAAAARALAAEHRLVLGPITLRALRSGAETALSWATRDWTHVRLAIRQRGTLGAAVHAAEVHRQLLAEAIARSGSFPAWSAPAASRAQLLACHPGLPAFLAEKRRYDPGERLRNDWYRAVSALLQGAPAL